MNLRTTLGILVVVAIVIVVGLNFRPHPPAGRAPHNEPAARQEQVDPQTERNTEQKVEETIPEEEKESAPVSLWRDMKPDSVTSLSFARPGAAPHLVFQKDDNRWHSASLYNAPAENAEIAAFLDRLFLPPTPYDSGKAGFDPVSVGLGSGQGLEIRAADGEQEAKVMLGSGFEDFPGVYMKAADSDSVVTVAADLRGDLGLWDNNPEAVPDASLWLKRRVLDLDPNTVVQADLECVGQYFDLVKDENSVWTLDGGGLAGKHFDLDSQAVQAWISDVANLTVSGVENPDRYMELGFSHPTHMIKFNLDGGEIISAAGLKAEDGEYYVEISSQPGMPYRLPEWRFDLYFHKFPDIFPKAVPAFLPADVKVVDLRQGGVNMKLAKRDGSWYGVGIPYPVRREAVEAWLRILSAWRPLDYIGGINDVPRPLRSAPTVELSLPNDVVQYRLGGQQQQLGGRSITLADGNAFTTSRSEAKRMFPQFADILEFGAMIPDKDAAAVEYLELSWPGRAPGWNGIALKQDESKPGSWKAVANYGEKALDSETALRLAAAPLTWRITDIHDQEDEEFESIDRMELVVRLNNGKQTEQRFTLFADDNEIAVRDSFLNAFDIDVRAFSSWLEEMEAIQNEMEEAHFSALEDNAKTAKTPENDVSADEAIESGSQKSAAETEQTPAGSELSSEHPDASEPIQPSVADPVSESLPAPASADSAHPEEPAIAQPADAVLTDAVETSANGDEPPAPVFLLSDLHLSDIEALRIDGNGFGEPALTIAFAESDTQEGWRIEAGEKYQNLGLAQAWALLLPPLRWVVLPEPADAFQDDAMFGIRAEFSLKNSGKTDVEILLGGDGPAFVKIGGNSPLVVEHGEIDKWLAACRQWRDALVAEPNEEQSGDKTGGQETSDSASK